MSTWSDARPDTERPGARARVADTAHRGDRHRLRLPPGAHQAARPPRLGAPRPRRPGAGRGARRDARQRGRRRPRDPRVPRPGSTSSASAAALPGLGVVVCTGRSTVAQRVRGLRLGADDWLTKPCHPEELIARVEAVGRRRRRAEPRADVAPVLAGELEVRADQFQAFVDGRSIDLTRREFELIELLSGAAGPRPRARGDLPARLGLRDGPRRPLGRRLRAQAAPEARARPRPTGATSTRTSASATASRRSRRGRAARSRTRRRSRSRAGRPGLRRSTDERRQLSRRCERAAPRRTLSA